MIKKISIRFILLLSILVISNFSYKYTFWPNDQTKHADLLDSLDLIKTDTDILFLSSSSNYFHPKTDTSSLWISQYLDKFYPSIKINAMHKGYMHAGIFHTILKNIPENSPIKTIIIPINLRSFGAFWVYSNVESSYSSQQLMMNSDYPVLLRRLLLAFDYFDNKTDAEREIQFKTKWSLDTIKSLGPDFPYKTVIDWDKAIAKGTTFKKADNTLDYDKIGFACNIVKAFAFEIDTASHPRIADLDAIVALAQDRNWELVFHILPEDFEKANSMVGKNVSKLLENNKNIIIDRYQKNKKIEVIDNLFLLDRSFFYESYPTEHYTSYGKYLIAETLAEYLKKNYSKQYQKLETSSKKRSNWSTHDINNKIATIKSDSLWYQHVIKKAEEKSISIDSMLILDAIWSLKKDYINNLSPEIKKTIKRIKNNPEWYQNIQKKAKKNNISINKQLEEDAKWVLSKK